MKMAHMISFMFPRPSSSAFAYHGASSVVSVRCWRKEDFATGHVALSNFHIICLLVLAYDKYICFHVFNIEFFGPDCYKSDLSIN